MNYLYGLKRKYGINTGMIIKACQKAAGEIRGMGDLKNSGPGQGKGMTH